jgi:hypothetical protein
MWCKKRGRSLLDAQLSHVFRPHLLVRERLAAGGSQRVYGLLNRAPCTILALRDVPRDVESCLGACVLLGGLINDVAVVRRVRLWPMYAAPELPPMAVAL